MADAPAMAPARLGVTRRTPCATGHNRGHDPASVGPVGRGYLDARAGRPIAVCSHAISMHCRRHAANLAPRNRTKNHIICARPTRIEEEPLSCSATLANNTGSLIDYGERYRSKMPISTSRAEGCVDEIVPAGRSSRRRRPRRGVGWPTETGSERPSRRLKDQDFSAPQRSRRPATAIHPPRRVSRRSALRLGRVCLTAAAHAVRRNRRRP
jgi:hypothetical protein